MHISVSHFSLAVHSQVHINKSILDLVREAVYNSSNINISEKTRTLHTAPEYLYVRYQWRSTVSIEG